jgi:hypothetical protein
MEEKECFSIMDKAFEVKISRKTRKSKVNRIILNYIIILIIIFLLLVIIGILLYKIKILNQRLIKNEKKYRFIKMKNNLNSTLFKEKDYFNIKMMNLLIQQKI